MRLAHGLRRPVAGGCGAGRCHRALLVGEDRSRPRHRGESARFRPARLVMPSRPRRALGAAARARAATHPRAGLRQRVRQHRGERGRSARSRCSRCARAPTRAGRSVPSAFGRLLRRLRRSGYPTRGRCPPHRGRDPRGHGRRVAHGRVGAGDGRAGPRRLRHDRSAQARVRAHILPALSFSATAGRAIW